MRTVPSTRRTLSIASLLLSATLLAGCSATALDTNLGADHPAHPDAASAPLPESSSVLNTPSVEPASHEMDSTADQHGDHSTPASAAEPTTYVCPMHPDVTSPKPGKCPKCGMDLKPKGQ